MDALDQRLAVRSAAKHAALTPDQQWLMRCLGMGLSDAEIARITGRSRQAVGQMRKRAAARFAEGTE